jgi:hypothetical protein
MGWTWVGMSRNGLTDLSKEIRGGAVVAGRKLKGCDAGFDAENRDEPLSDLPRPGCNRGLSFQSGPSRSLEDAGAYRRRAVCRELI